MTPKSRKQKRQGFVSPGVPVIMESRQMEVTADKAEVVPSSSEVIPNKSEVTPRNSEAITMSDGMQEIVLKTGEVVTRKFVEDYVAGVTAADASGEKFPVKFNDLWPYGFSRKHDGWQAFLAMQPVVGEDFEVIRNFPENPNPKGGRPEKNYAVTLRMAEHFCMAYRPEVRDIYIRFRQELTARVKAGPDVSQFTEILGRMEARISALCETVSELQATNLRLESLEQTGGPAPTYVTLRRFADVFCKGTKFLPGEMRLWGQKMVAYCKSRRIHFEDNPKRYPEHVIGETLVAMMGDAIRRDTSQQMVFDFRRKSGMSSL